MQPYEPTAQSLETHTVPDWYADAKLGIFVHWGLYSVPGWADPEGENAYAEWYPRKMYQEGTPTYEYHREHYGESFEYIDFAEEWNAERWDPEEWAEFFDDVGAGYVVLTGEHHDGFPLWPSHYTKYNAAEMGPERDLVGELSEAVRDRGMRFAASYHANLNYYQPGFEGPFGHPDFEDGDSPQPGPEYVDFMNAKHREIIRRYQPDLLWFDTPQASADRVRSRELIAEYYNRARSWGTEVAVNDRASTDDNALAGHDPDDSARPGGDFGTPEYATLSETMPFKWELCRGIGRSFGYNRNEGPKHHMDTAELVRLLVDVVAKNGNLLINVGPKADGTIPALQRQPLEGLGRWLSTNGEAIYGTTYWRTPSCELTTEDGSTTVHYTWKDDVLYAILDDYPRDSFVLSELEVEREAISLRRLDGGVIDWQVSESGVRVSVPASSIDPAPAHSIAIENVPHPRLE
jgi:alpha-L-fucosidase